MGQVGQTPGMFVLAAGSSFFDAACQKALLSCGLHPDDFGTYDSVKERIREAKRKVMEHKLARRRGDPNPPPEPTAHDRLLAQSEAGHLRQNALFQRTRGNSCQNEQPRQGHPGARGYHHDLAPCGPHPVGTGSSNVGTTHWAQGRLEAEVRQGRTPGDPVGSEEIRNRSSRSSELTVNGASDQQLQDQDRWAKRRRTQEAQLREQSANELTSAEGKTVDGPDDTDANAANKKKAAECIDAFTDEAFKAMQKQAMHDYSKERYEETKKGLEAAEAEAAANKQRADAQFQSALEEARKPPPRPGRWDDVQRAGMARSQANQDLALARAANASSECMRDQVQSLQSENGGEPQEMSGSVPGWGSGNARRPPYPESVEDLDER